MNIFEKRESQVRSYCRSFPKVFVKAKGSVQTDRDGKEYIDFFAGAGALNYGHNNDDIKEKLIAYLEGDYVIHGLDFFTQAKEDFLTCFDEKILTPRNYPYKVQFCGPTGTNAVETAIKLARKNTGRMNIFAFTGAFHGMTQGSLSLTSALDYRKSIAPVLVGSVFMPYPFAEYAKMDTIGYMRTILSDDHSGIEKPAAIILETVQAEGGVCVAPDEWLRDVRQLCDDFGILLIVDDIQVGCGRTGEFFSFEQAGIVPDMVTLSKSISGYGLPMSLLLLKEELDTWAPGEQSGTYRGNQMAFVAAKAAIEYFYAHDIPSQVKQKHAIIDQFVKTEILPLDKSFEGRGRGLIYGIDLKDGALAKETARLCFENGLIIERAGRGDTVLKVMPPLVIEEDLLKKGLMIIKDSLKKAMQTR